MRIRDRPAPCRVRPEPSIGTRGPARRARPTRQSEWRLLSRESIFAARVRCGPYRLPRDVSASRAAATDKGAPGAADQRTCGFVTLALCRAPTYAPFGVHQGVWFAKIRRGRSGTIVGLSECG